ncbi:acyltransferase family protein [Pleionea sediminis]|uniref:acyltransferase family protein n=1 Tax=Pleionea sediminis TaxID=2569479 RepID=UPI0013DDA5C2|nr:acyltransferase family protein [Pleionea sediminis]
MVDNRRYDIDWLRTLAFLLLIFYHIGMFYVFDWGWHVKSQHQSEFLQNLMLLSNRWRMPLIFLISGMALALVEPKLKASQLLKLRSLRVFIPLVIGMYIIVPPQLYYELVHNAGFQGSYIEFMNFYINPNTTHFKDYQYSPLGLLTWNHLWYLAYLFAYTLIYLAIRPALMYITNNTSMIKLSIWVLLITLTTWIGIAMYWIKPLFPTTHALVDDWFSHAIYFPIFFLGYLLPKCTLAWKQAIQHRRTWLIGAIIGYVCTLILHNGRLDHWLIHHGFDLQWLAAQGETYFIIFSIRALNLMCWLFMLVGYAGHYLRQNNRFLQYMNEAVLPFYILHQTITIIVAMQLQSFALGPFWEPLTLIILTFAGCAMSYEVIRRNAITRFMFGMKLNAYPGKAQALPLSPANASSQKRIRDEVELL